MLQFDESPFAALLIISSMLPGRSVLIRYVNDQINANVCIDLEEFVFMYNLKNGTQKMHT